MHETSTNHRNQCVVSNTAPLSLGAKFYYCPYTAAVFTHPAVIVLHFIQFFNLTILDMCYIDKFWRHVLCIEKLLNFGLFVLYSRWSQGQQIRVGDDNPRDQKDGIFNHSQGSHVRDIIKAAHLWCVHSQWQEMRKNPLKLSKKSTNSRKIML